MDQKKYNGWYNYATWRMNLEFFADHDWTDTFEHYYAEDGAVYEISLELRDMVEEFIDAECQNTWLRGWLHAFLDDVHFYEIAKHIYRDIEEAIADAETEDEGSH